MSELAEDDKMLGVRNPFVRAIALGRMAGTAGQQIVVVAVGWLLYERTGSAWALGLVGLVELAPALLLMIVAGNIIDSFPRKFIGMLATVGMAIAAFGLAWAAVVEADTFWIYALLLTVGIARAFYSPSVGSILPQLLKPEQFNKANAWVSSGVQFAAVGGPGLGGVLIAITGDTILAFFVAGAFQLLLIGMLATLPRIAPPPRKGKRSMAEVLGGFRIIKQNPIFLASITLDLFAVLLGGAVVLLPIFAKDILEVGPVGLGWLRAAPSIGALAAGLLQTRLPPWKRPGDVMLISVVGFGIATIGFGLSTNFWLSLFFLGLTGAFDSLSVVIRITLEQVITPDHMRGRVSAINFLFIGMSNELGAFRAGATAAMFGAVGSVVTGGIGTLLTVLVVALIWPQLRHLGPLHTIRPMEEPDEDKVKAPAQ